MLLQVYDLTKSRRFIDAVKKILGEDLLVWWVSLFITEPHSKKIFSWHQGLTYLDLDNS